MQRIDLDDVEKELRSHGFALRVGTLSDVSIASIMQQKWKQDVQKGGANESTLRPMDQTRAPLRTLSAVHGLGAQPLHTDGAHLKQMPDVIVLHAPSPTETATIVWNLGRKFPSSLRSGVFTVHGNAGGFLAHALANQRLRFDPVCMSPADNLAKEAMAFFDGVRDDAYCHHWSQSDTLLFIDNTMSLHAREAVVDGEAASRVIRRAAYSSVLS